MSDTQIEVINAEFFNDSFTGLILNSVPYLYWKEIYQKLGIKKNHAYSVLKRLEYGKHFISYTYAEMEAIYTHVHKPCTLPPTTRYVFLTAEGYHRAIIEIKTGYILDPNIAATIDALKDKMASIYTRYQRGEVLSLSTEKGQVQQIPERVSVSDALTEQMKRASAMAIVGVDMSLAASVCLTKVEEQYPGEDLSYLRGLLVRQIEGEIGYLTATAIGKEIGATNRTINNILCQAGYQYRTERTKKNGKTEWVYNLTEKGKLFGEVHVGHFGGAERYIILWRSTIIDEIRRVIFSSESQSTLSGVA